MQRRISILATVSALVSALVLAIWVIADSASPRLRNSPDTIILASHTTKADIAPQTFAPAPRPDWLDDMICILECLKSGPGLGVPEECCEFCPEACDDGLAAVEAAIVDGEIPGHLHTWAANVLDKVGDLIDQIQGPAYPDLDPEDAGQPGSSQTFQALRGCAEQCTIWAQDALAAIQESPPDHEAAGYALDSIKNALPQYKSLAGLN